jgi:GNAT superfamily N-acetyltransferase
MVIEVRPLAASDSIAEITGLLHRAYARLGTMGFNHTAVDQAPETTAQRIQGGTCYVATLDGAIVGTIVVQPTYLENTCEYFTRTGVAAAHQFGVEPALQRFGIGRMLLRRAEEWAVCNGFSELSLDTAERATHLIAMYKKAGYRHVGWVQWPGKTFRCVVLSKTLAEMPVATY